MTRMHSARWITLRHDFIDWFGSVIEPRTIVTNRRHLFIALGFSVQFLQARVPEGEPFRHIHSSADDFDVCPRLTFASCFQCSVELTERFDARGKPVRASERAR